MAKFWNVAKYVGLASIFGALLILFIMMSKRNAKIALLELKIRELQAKVKLEKLTFDYNMSVVDLKELRKADDILDDKISEIEVSLEMPLSNICTAEEIAAAFKRLGLT